MEIFKLEEYLAKYEFVAKYLLCCSDAESFHMSEIIGMASSRQMDLWQHLRLGYTEVPGLPALRETVAEELYPGLKAGSILTFAGAEEGIFCTLNAIVAAADHVIVLTPCYQSLFEIPKSRGANITEIQLKEENDWRIDLHAIQRTIKSNTKCIIINFPHNPTGQVIEEGELKSLVEICESNGIWLFSDEVYRLLGKPEQPWAPPAACIYNKALSLGVMSKAFGMAGLRIGWIACQDQPMLKKIEQMKHYTSICNSAPSEILTLIALRNKDAILERNNKIVADHLKLLDQFFIEYSHLFEWVRPQGGCVGFVKYKGAGSIESFCDRLVNKRNVLLMPASIYDYASNHFRIGFGRKNMPECLDQLKEFLRHENI
ncbi:aminotransferase class I/II-fold pyridoxal phosphate-dependent enzyme [Rickettsiales endosymbiont of Peranema trichophorum]|uniref:aminotransferase class I/II-fold pyridoxal phosphate-dependent enzyme n=1 Tax=Rickettsiales endosymbiont of Peranema trichophorum TaxID=2486577 RepID=UPI0013EE8095|nr:aminotransferase class I/II-fold pyridoxal phosphate-dependent enzyme [Rickettsiales endosymbiont of Peranema trichophorum]